MRRFAIRILIAVLTFTAGVVVSRMFLPATGEFKSFQALDKLEGWKRSCKKKRRGHVQLGEAPPRVADVSLVQPHDIGYAEAIEFADFLRDTGIKVRSIHRSKFESLFETSDRAAHFRTDRGTVDVIFFSEASGAEDIRVNEQGEGQRYVYELRTPHETQILNSRWPNYIVRHQQWFISTPSEALAEKIKNAL